MGGGEIEFLTEEEVNNDPEMSADAENFDQDGIERKIFCDGNVYKQMEEGEEWILDQDEHYTTIVEKDARVPKRNIRLAELSLKGRLRKEMMEREATADRDPLLIDFKRWLKEYEHRPGELFLENTVTTYYRIVRRLFFDEDDIEVIEGRAVCVWRGLHAIANRHSSLEDQYNAIRRFVEFRGVGDEANDDHNEEDQRIFKDWLVENQHQREARQRRETQQ